MKGPYKRSLKSLYLYEFEIVLKQRDGDQLFLILLWVSVWLMPQ